MKINMAKKTTKKAAEKALNIDNILFNCRDILRAARNSGSFFEKRDMMLTLVFLRFIGEKYEDGIENLRQTLIEQGLDPDDEDIRTAFFDDATFADGTYNLPVEARWSTIINTPAPILKLFDELYDSMTDYEKKNFMQSFIESIDLFPKNGSKRGTSIKTIHFRFPVSYNGESVYEVSLRKDSTVESVVLLTKVQK